MHGSGIAIWFFIGILLVIYGGMICGYGIYEAATGTYAPGVQLTQLHTPIWWGGFLALVGVFYLVRYRPGQNRR
jgi:hypothetical protein